MEKIREYIRELGYSFEPSSLDSSWHEWSDGKSKGWYIGRELGGGKYIFTFGDWRTGEKYSTQIGLDASEQTREELERLKQKAREERFKRAEEAAVRCEAHIKSAPNPSTLESPYLTSKKLTQTLGTRTVLNSWGKADLLIPMYSFDQTQAGSILWNYQRIQPDGFKQFCEGARVSGCFHIVGRHGISSTSKEVTLEVYICEGYATGLSIHNSLIRQNRQNFAVVVSFNASNLPKVAQAFHKQLETRPNSKLFICADNDTITEKKTKTNPGLLAANRALSLVEHKAKVLFPKNIKGSDWNDFEAELGPEALDQELKTQIENPHEIALPKLTKVKAPKFVEPYVNGLAPLPPDIGPDGKPKPLEELEVAHYVLEYLKDSGIGKRGRDLFFYNGKYWEEMNQTKEDYIKTQILVAMRGKGSHKKVDSVFRLMCIIVPTIPVNPFEHKPTLINVANGTIRLKRSGDTWHVEFGPHSKDDYLTTFIPYPYDPEAKPGKLFLEMLQNVFHEDPDKESKIALIEEMYGSALAPIHPRLFLLYGRGGSGKTSLIMPALRLVDIKNTSMVEPSQMEGFMLSAMAGKLVNYVSDIDVNMPMKDNIVKQIEDRNPMLINRKFKDPFYAHIPIVHIFAGNEIPPTLERGSGAYLRRWSFIHCNSMDRSRNPTFNYANLAFEENPSGILNFALDGLLRLLNRNGKFTEYGEERKEIEAWQLEHDFVHQFLKDIGAGEAVGLRYNPEGKVKQSVVWDKFREWHETSYSRLPRIGRNKFYKVLSQKLALERTRILENFGVKPYFSTLEGYAVLRGVELTHGSEF